MRRALLVIFVVAVAGGLLAATAGARIETRFSVVEIHKSQHKVGNSFVTLSTLWSPITGSRVGRDIVKVTPKSRSRAKIHAIAFFRGEGKLKVQGAVTGPPNRNNSRFIIVGGTGEFNGAAGKVKVHTINHSRNLLHFAFVQ